MTTFKRMLRVLALTLLIIVASMGAGLAAAILPKYYYMDKEIKTEQVDKKRKEEESEKE